MDRLKLRAVDEEDLKTVAAVLQDALVTMSEMTYLPRERRFVLVANRFRWEAEAAGRGAPSPVPEPPGATLFERVMTGLCFERVRSVYLKNLDRRRRNAILMLLHIDWQPGAVTLIFAGGGAVRLEADAIDCRLDDLCEPWPTPFHPRHALDGEEPELGGGSP